MTGGAMGNFVETSYNGKILTMEDMRNTRQVWAFNGVANLADAPLFSARRGESIVIEAANRTAFPHSVHVHGHHFRVIESGQGGDGKPGPWRDTVLINPDQTMLVAFVADNPGKWLLHCHMLEHAAAGMNTWFEVL
jgi:FtsP/CotA-like multicopper oxidase with cupredoxin domain